MEARRWTMHRTRRPAPSEIPVFVASPQGLELVGGIPFLSKDLEGEPRTGFIGGVAALFKWSRGRMTGVYVYSVAEANTILASFDQDLSETA